MGFQGLRDNCSTRHLLLTSVTALCEVTFRHFPPKSSIHSGSRQQANTELPSKRNAEETKVPTVDLFLRLTGGRQPTALNSGKEGGTKTSPSSGRSENVNTLSPIGTVPCCTRFHLWSQRQESGPARDRGLCPAGKKANPPGLSPLLS